MDEVLKSVKAVIESTCMELYAENNRSNREWTQRLHQAIYSEIKKKYSGYMCCCSNCKDKEADGEWLYDMTWYKEDADRCLEELLLVLESEWSTYKHDIRYDFQKLLQAKCPNKVFIGCCETENYNLIEDAQRQIQAFKAKSVDEQYLIANCTRRPDVRVISGEGRIL